MRTAYLILAHKNQEQLSRLVNLLSSGDNSVFIHVDSKWNFNFRQFYGNLSDHSSVYFIGGKNLTWGGYSLTEATIDLLNYVLEVGHFDYVSLISGLDSPLKSDSFIKKFLKQGDKSEFIECFPLPDVKRWRGDFGTNRFERFWFIDNLGFKASREFINRQIEEKIVRHMPLDMKPFGGSQWFTITYDCANYVCEFIRENPEITEFFKYTLASDEVIFNSIIMNSAFREKVRYSNLRYIDWLTSSGVPKTLGLKDLANMEESGCLFARKFDCSVDNTVIDVLERRLLS